MTDQTSDPITPKVLKAIAKALNDTAENAEEEERLEAYDKAWQEEQEEFLEVVRTVSKRKVETVVWTDNEVPVTACERCPALCESRNTIVNGRGPDNPGIMIVGEAPGNDEDKTGKPFMGMTGKLLAELLKRANIELGDVYLTNATRCRPPQNRQPTPLEMANCHPYLIEEIKQKQPKVIVTVGASALAAMYKRVPLNTVIGQVLIQPDTGIPIIPTYHPAFLLRGNWQQAELVVAHLDKAARLASGELVPQTMEEAKENWRACTTVEEVQMLHDYLTGPDVRVIAFDTETTGLSWMTEELLCISFSALDKNMRADHLGWTVPLMHKVGGDLVPFWSEESWGTVEGLIRCIMESDKGKTIQNAQFDIKFMERGHDDVVRGTVDNGLWSVFGMKVNNLAYDPMLLQRVVNENLPANETVMLSLYTDMPFYEEEMRATSGNKHHMADAPTDVLWTYAAADADGLARLTEILVRKAAQQRVLWLHDNISIPMVRATWNMTRRGMDIDMDYFVRLCDRYETLIKEAEDNCYRLAGKEFNLNKPADIQDLLFTTWDLPRSGRKTEKSKECEACANFNCDKHDATGKDALKDIQALLEDGHPGIALIDAILHWKETSKRRSTYVNGKDGDKGMLRWIRPDGCIHPEFKVNRADTGRLSAVDPPVQTIPKRVEDTVLEVKDQLRRPFTAPEGFTMMELDWSQGEVWVMAYESGDAKLLELLQNGRDVHTYVARTLASFGISRVFPATIENPDMPEWEWKKEYDEYRRKAKVFVFGLDYGMTAIGAAERLGCTPEEAQQLIDAFLTKVFPSLREHFAKVRKQMQENGYVIDRFGRRGHFGEYHLVKPFGARGMTYWEGRFRKGVNMPIQAGLNDLHQLLHVQIEFDEALGARYRITNAVHDSVLGPAKGKMGQDDEYLLQTAFMLKEKAEDMAKHLVLPDGTELAWEIPVEVQWGHSWGDFQWTLGADGNVKGPNDAAG